MQFDSARWPRLVRCHDGPFDTGTHYEPGVGGGQTYWDKDITGALVAARYQDGIVMNPLQPCPTLRGADKTALDLQGKAGEIQFRTGFLY